MTAQRVATPTSDDADMAAEASRALSGEAAASREFRVSLMDGTAVRLPKAAAELLQIILAEMARGRTVRVTPVDAELTTQEAAAYLNVSRPFLIGLLGSGSERIPYRKVGTHRRIKLVDLETYLRNVERLRDDTMQELADQAQEMGLGY